MSEALKPYDVAVSLDASRDEVWESLSRPDALRQWFGWDYDGLDAEIQQIFVDRATLIGPGRMGWADGSYLDVSGDEDGSVARAVREGPAPADPDRYDAIEEGWRSFLIQLRFWLDRRPEGDRRTVYLTGEVTGQRVLSLVPGDWRRAGPRTAWVVGPDGHLVVVSSRTHLDSPQHGRTEVTVSTYGLDESAFAGCHHDWTDRWASAAADPSVTVAGQPAPS